MPLEGEMATSDVSNVNLSNATRHETVCEHGESGVTPENSVDQVSRAITNDFTHATDVAEKVKALNSEIAFMTEPIPMYTVSKLPEDGDGTPACRTHSWTSIVVR